MLAVEEDAVRYLEVDGAALASLGFAPADILGRTFAEIYPGADGPALQAALLARIRQGKRFRVQAELDLPTGKRVLDMTFAPHLPAGQRLGYVVGAAQDVTDRVMATRVLAEREQQLAESQRLARLGSWTFVFGKGWTGWSEVMSEIHGLGGPPSSGHAFLHLLHPDDRRRIVHTIRRRLRDGRSFTEEYRVRQRPGDPERWVSMTGRALDARSGGAIGESGCGPSLGVTGVFGTCQDITERKASERALVHQALHDALTGLPNRVLLLDRLEHSLSRAARASGAVAVLFIDLDHFKDINDNLGHSGGDTLLIEVARRLVAALRPEDTVARLGGDEFVIVCDDLTTGGEAIVLAGRVADAFAAPFHIGHHEVSVTASIGIRLAVAGQDSAAVVRDADAAMYQAKDRGRACAVVFDSAGRFPGARPGPASTACGTPAAAGRSGPGDGPSGPAGSVTQILKKATDDRKVGDMGSFPS